jgi:hypothetical protein
MEKKTGHITMVRMENATTTKTQIVMSLMTRRMRRTKKQTDLLKSSKTSSFG